MQWDPRSQRPIRNTLQAHRLARPPSRENLKKDLRDKAAGSAKPTLCLQHPQAAVHISEIMSR